jgi:hypothetical protein
MKGVNTFNRFCCRCNDSSASKRHVNCLLQRLLNIVVCSLQDVLYTWGLVERAVVKTWGRFRAWLCSVARASSLPALWAQIDKAFYTLEAPRIHTHTSWEHHTTLRPSGRITFSRSSMASTVTTPRRRASSRTMSCSNARARRTTATPTSLY